MSHNAVIFHHNDPDGHVSGFIAENYLVDAPDTASVFTKERSYGAPYNGILSVIDTDTPIEVWFVDLSFTENTKEDLKEFIKNDKRIKRVVWIDHHASSGDIINEMHEFFKENLDSSAIVWTNDFCGACLTYIYTDILIDYSINKKQFMYKHTIIKPDRIESYGGIVDASVTLDNGEKHIIGIHDFLIHLDNHDRWTRKDPLCEYFIKGYMASDFSMTRIDYKTRSTIYRDAFILFNECDNMIEAGKYIMKFEKNRYISESKYIRYTTIYGHNIAIKNAHGNSDNFLDLLDENKVSFVIIYRFDPNTMKWYHSIYGNKNLTVKVNKLAEVLGGGGHPGAAGFVIDAPIFSYNDEYLEDAIHEIDTEDVWKNTLTNIKVSEE